MTRLEAAILALIAAALVLRQGRLGPDGLHIALLVLIAILIVVRLWRNPARWQMAPATLVAAGLAATAPADVALAGWAGAAALVVGLALLALSAALASGFPLRPLPAPSGPYKVGVVTLALERRDAAGESRRLLVKAWYPADPDPARHRREPLWAELYGGRDAPMLLRALTGYLRELKSHAHQAAPLAAAGAPYPLLVYSHALVSMASENTLLMEQLASDGFIAVAVSHRDQLAEHAAIQSRLSDDERARDRALQARLAGDLSRDERARLSAELYRASTGAPIIVARRAEDARYVVDHIGAVLAAIPGCDPENGAVAEPYGAVGLSLGGAAATLLCATDPRCGAAVNLDGGLFGVNEDAAIDAPYLMLYSAQNAGSNDGFRHLFGAGYEESVVAAKHLDLHDAAVAAPGLRLTGALGPAGRRVNACRNQAVSSFFDRTLRTARDDRRDRRPREGR